MTPEILECLRAAGRIAAEVRRSGARRVQRGALVRDVCEAVEADIVRLGGGVAFPVQSSRNDIAAHYCPPPEDETIYMEGDLAKLDIGVHVDGWVVDTAVTVSVGDRAENRAFIAAAEAALESAIEAAHAGVRVRDVSSAIERTLASHKLRPMRNLCGHGVGRYIVHSPPPIPNSPEPTEVILPTHAVVAVEPFATDGHGLVGERGTAEVFRVDPDRLDRAGLDGHIAEALTAFRGLPFARRQLRAFPRAHVEATLQALRQRGQLTSYPPLVERSGRKVAQAEHTLYLGPDGTEVLTR